MTIWRFILYCFLRSSNWISFVLFLGRLRRSLGWRFWLFDFFISKDFVCSDWIFFICCFILYFTDVLFLIFQIYVSVWFFWWLYFWLFFRLFLEILSVIIIKVLLIVLLLFERLLCFDACSLWRIGGDCLLGRRLNFFGFSGRRFDIFEWLIKFFLILFFINNFRTIFRDFLFCSFWFCLGYGL